MFHIQKANKISIYELKKKINDEMEKCLLD